ncbi:MAG: acetolactate synthase small subunit [Finegoldia sp.]|nr:acetolactate synthase small subunit [Finegoldia sp.]
MQHTISVIVENRAGVLTRVTGLFSRRGYNIESLAVGQTDIAGVSRITIVVNGDEKVIEQVSKQLYKLIDVIKVVDLTEEEHVERGLILIKVHVDKSTRTEIIQVANIFRARIIDMSPESFVVEATGTSSKLLALQEALRPYGIIEIARTGRIALARGKGGY